MTYLSLYWEFFKTGLFAIGGGLATLPFLQNISAKTGWFTLQDLANMVAVSESTPGPIGVNMATYVGYTVGGILGSVIATLGLITPEIIIILVISYFLTKYKENRFVKGAMLGLRPASCGLIACAFLELVILVFFENSLSVSNINLFALALAAFLLIATRYIPKVKKLHPIVFIIFSAFIGIISKL